MPAKKRVRDLDTPHLQQSSAGGGGAMAEISPTLRGPIRRAIQRFRPHSPPPNWNAAEWNAELYQEGILAALEAEQKFDPSLNTKFEDFVYNCVCARLKTFTNREWAYQKAVVPFPEDAETGEVWEPADEQSELDYQQVELRETTQWLMDQLTADEVQLWRWMAEGRSLRCIGKQLGISHTMVRKRWERLQKKLQGLLEKTGQVAAERFPNDH